MACTLHTILAIAAADVNRQIRLPVQQSLVRTSRWRLLAAAATPPREGARMPRTGRGRSGTSGPPRRPRLWRRELESRAQELPRKLRRWTARLAGQSSMRGGGRVPALRRPFRRSRLRLFRRSFTGDAAAALRELRRELIEVMRPARCGSAHYASRLSSGPRSLTFHCLSAETLRNTFRVYRILHRLWRAQTPLSSWAVSFPT